MPIGYFNKEGSGSSCGPDPGDIYSGVQVGVFPRRDDNIERDLEKER
jgi:hypothetical protein